MSMDIGDKRLGVLMLLVKLNVVGMTHHRFSMASYRISGNNFIPPPCSIQLAITGLALEFIEFVPLKKSGTI